MTSQRTSRQPRGAFGNNGYAGDDQSLLGSAFSGNSYSSGPIVFMLPSQLDILTACTAQGEQLWFIEPEPHERCTNLTLRRLVNILPGAHVLTASCYHGLRPQKLSPGLQGAWCCRCSLQGAAVYRVGRAQQRGQAPTPARHCLRQEPP